MKRFFSTSSLITASIISVSLLSSSMAIAKEPKQHGAAAEFTTKFSKKRNLAEFDYMQPIFAEGNHLPLIDLKLKLDNQKSKEVNLGLVYRYNYNDNAILGVYGYYDYRRTGHNFSVSGVNSWW